MGIEEESEEDDIPAEEDEITIEEDETTVEEDDITVEEKRTLAVSLASKDKFPI